ncbi:MAG: sugar ABC transporter ATP-binding protein [Lachnospiraceae bacterium]
MGNRKALLRVENMVKSFGITRALRGVRLTLMQGEILGLIGENGSGKSTLTSIIAGIQPADEGTIFLEDEAYQPRRSVEANNMGIRMILQEKATFDNLTVAQNIFVGQEKHFKKNGILDNRKMNQKAAEALEKIGASHIKPGDKVSSLSFEDGKLIELARAINTTPRILIVDETTTALSRTGRDILYDIMKKLKEGGNSVIFISHDIDEMMNKCDRLTVLRDGSYIDTLEKNEFAPDKIRKLMVGREITDNYYRNDMETCQSDEVVLNVDQICTERIKNISFQLHRGEILGFGGLADSGMHDIGKAAFGVIETSGGKVSTGDGTIVTSAMKAMDKKIAYIGKNRDQESLFINGPIRDNVASASYKHLSKFSFISPKKENEFVWKWTKELDVKMQGISQYVMELSGGNKQKVAIAKWLGFGADIFILDCPTRGIDIGVKAGIYELMEQLKKEGKSIILISEELPEVIGMSDRIIVLKNGEISGEFLRNEDLSETTLIDYMV